MSLTVERLREVLDYDKETGVFRWRPVVGKRTRGRRKDLDGNIAGTQHAFGHVSIRIDGRFYRAHRLAWFYIHERWPAHQIDHINRDQSDNRLLNLRQATNAQNSRNKEKYASNKSGKKGVSWDRQNKRWRASIVLDGKARNLGRFDKIEDAERAYADASQRFHGVFRRV